MEKTQIKCEKHDLIFLPPDFSLEGLNGLLKNKYTINYTKKITLVIYEESSYYSFD